jgi:hypothetical protein
MSPRGARGAAGTGVMVTVRRRTLVLLVGLGVVLLAGAAAAVLWFSGIFDDEKAVAAPPPPGLDQSQADRLATGLADPDPAHVADVLSEDAAAAYLQAPAPVIPPGSTLVLDASTFTVTGAVDAAVAGTVTSGAQATDVVLLLALEDGEWRVLTSVTA